MQSLVNFKKFFPTFLVKKCHPVFSLQQEVEKAFNQFYHDLELEHFSPKKVTNLPIYLPFDVIEDKKEYKIKTEMPGLGEEDIKVSVEENILHVQTRKETSRKDEGKNYIRREINYGSYESYIELPPYVDTNQAKVLFKKGILWISFTKKEGAEHAVKKLTVEKAE